MDQEVPVPDYVPVAAEQQVAVEYVTSYLCEFSLPVPTKPVPIATVKVFFTLAEEGG